MGIPTFSAMLFALVFGSSPIFCVGLIVFPLLLERTQNLIFRYGVPRRAMRTFRRSDVFDAALRISHRNAISDSNNELRTDSSEL